MGLETTALQARTVVRQPQPPTNTELIWIDTSASTPVVKQYYPSESRWGKVVEVSTGPTKFYEAQSFEEATLSRTENKTAVNNGSVEIDSIKKNATFVDNFESGDLSGWSGDLSHVSVTESAGYFGTYGVQISEGTGAISPKLGGSTKNAILRFETSGSWGTTGPRVRFYDTNNTFIGALQLNAFDSDLKWSETGTIGGGNNHTLALRWDFGNNEVEIYDGDITNSLGVFPFANNVSNWDYVELNCNNPDTGYVDGLVGPNIPISGDILLEWDYPTDIFKWDTATFTQTQDNESVTVYIEYSTDGGNTWNRGNGGSPISRNYAIGEDTDISSEDRVRLYCELQADNNTNNPKLDSAYISWLL